MKTQLYFIILFIIPVFGISQSQKEHLPLRSLGVPPSHMSKSAIEKNDEREITTSPYRKRNERLAEIEFYASGTYAINDLLVSGDVIYGEAISAYLEKILAHIMEANGIKKEIAIHPVKSSVFNAFATEEPILFVNLGLIRSVRNEAEMAFVICHELAHHLNKHSLEGYLNQYKLESMKEYNSLSSYDKILKKHGYSRSMENDADSIGLIYFKNTKYSLPAAITVFDLMSDDFEEYTYENINSLVDFKGFYNSMTKEKLDSLNKIFINDSVMAEELSTHPDTKKRKGNIENWMGSNSSGQQFLQPESDFKEIQKLALLESLRLSLIEGNYPQAYFISHIVMRDYKEYDLYAKKQLFKSLISILDQKIPSGSDRKIELNSIRLSSASSYVPILYYYLQKTNQELITEIGNLIEAEFLAGNSDEELKALNNWFIKKVNGWAKENSELSTALKERSTKKHEFSSKKKIFVDPYFLSLDFRKVYQLDYIKTEKEQMKVNDKMKSYVKMRDDYSLISIADKSQLTSDLLYEKDIITKRLMEIDNTPEGKVTAFPTDYNQVNEICEKYGSERVSVTFAATAYYKANSSLGVAMLFFFAPLGIYMMAMPNYITVAQYQEFSLIEGTIDNKRSVQKKSKFSGSPMRELYFPRTK